MKYQIKIDREALKALAKLPKKFQRQIKDRIDALAQNAFPPGCKAIGTISGEKVYRIRSGDYRIGYQVKKRILLILVIRIRHRKDFYTYFG